MRQRDREKSEVAARCFDGSGIPQHFRSARLDDDLSCIPSDVRDQYAREFERVKVAMRKPGIYALCGEIGNGKTWMFSALASAFCADARSAHYLKTFDYIERYRATWKEGGDAGERFVARHVRFALLGLDEWQVRRDSPDENLILLRLLDKRYDAEKTTFLIGNQRTKQEFERTIDARIADRICEGGGIILCNWPSLRGRIRTDPA